MVEGPDLVDDLAACIVNRWVLDCPVHKDLIDQGSAIDRWAELTPLVDVISDLRVNVDGDVLRGAGASPSVKWRWH